MRDLPDLLRPGDALVVNDTKVIPARLRGRRIGRGERAEDRGDSAQAARRLALARLRPARRSGLRSATSIRFGDEGKVCFLGQLDATVEAKGEGGEVTLVLRFPWPGAGSGDRRARRRCRCRPISPAKRAPDERDRDRLPDDVRARRRLGRSADRGPAFHRRALGAACARAASRCTRSRCMSAPAPFCR